MDVIDELDHNILAGFGMLSAAININVQQFVDWDYELGVKWNRTGECFSHYRGIVTDWFEYTYVVYYNNREYIVIIGDDIHTYYEKYGEWIYNRKSKGDYNIENRRHIWSYEDNVLVAIYYKNHPYIHRLTYDEILMKRRVEGDYVYPSKIIKRKNYKNKLDKPDKKIYQTGSKFSNSILWYYNYAICTRYGELMKNTINTVEKCEYFVSPRRDIPANLQLRTGLDIKVRKLKMNLTAPANEDPYKTPEFM